MFEVEQKALSLDYIEICSLHNNKSILEDYWLRIAEIILFEWGLLGNTSVCFSQQRIPYYVHP